MMTKDTVTRDIVVEVVNEFITFWNEEQDDEVGSISIEDVTQDYINEINANIRASQESNVPELIWEVLAEENVVPDDEEAAVRFVTWYEEHHT